MTDRQTYRHDRQTDRQIDGHDRHTDRQKWQTHRQTDRDRQTDITNRIVLLHQLLPRCTLNIWEYI